MITSKKYKHHTGNKVPVWEVPGAYSVSLRAPWRQGNPGTPETFVASLRRDEWPVAVGMIKAIVKASGGIVEHEMEVYSSVYLKNMTDAGIDAVCELEQVHTVGPNVSISPPASHKFHRGETDKKPYSYENDCATAVAHLKRHNCL